MKMSPCRGVVEDVFEDDHGGVKWPCCEKISLWKCGAGPVGK